MFRFFQERFPDFPEVKFLLLMDITSKFVVACQNITIIQNSLTDDETNAAIAEGVRFTRNLGECVHNENASLNPLYHGISILNSIVLSYYMREESKPAHKDMVI